MHQTATTSLEQYKKLDTGDLCSKILSHMRERAIELCIADLANELHLERSTVSARLNELKHMGMLEYAGKKPSKKTGITSMHWKVKMQETLF